MIEKIIDDNENILWRGRPNVFLYIVGNPKHLFDCDNL